MPHCKICQSRLWKDGRCPRDVINLMMGDILRQVARELELELHQDAAAQLLDEATVFLNHHRWKECL